MRPDVRDPWGELLEAERRPTERGSAMSPVLSARKILLYVTFGAAGIALVIPIAATVLVFTVGLFREGVTTIQALLGR